MPGSDTSDTILLCGGKINYTHLPIVTNMSNSMIPVNGKPVVGWILDDLLSKDIRSVVVVLRMEDLALSEFLERAYGKRMELKLVKVENSPSILFSLKKGLEQVRFSNVRVLLGDTLVEDGFGIAENYVYVHEVPDSHRWCLAKIDGQELINGYYDKVPNAPLPHIALCGVYAFQDSKHLEVKLVDCLNQGKSQMSDLLSAYQETYPMRAKNANRWFDFGNIDNLVEAKQKLLQTRFFNTLTVDPVVNTITKMSQYDEKLQNELDWYEALPDRLKVLAPRIISKNRENGKLHLVSEYYGYPTLAELFVFSDLHVEYWSIILQRLMRLHMTFKEFESNLPADEIAYMYASKTFERIELLQKQNNEWREIFSYHEIFCNGNQLINFTEFKDAIYAKSELLAQNCKPCIMHGDFCFSNILYDLNNHIVRLIDPRGSFGRKGIYGDPRYDLAKLRHSICGWYDYITADLFEVERQENSFKLEIFVRSDLANLKNIFDHLLAQYGYDTKEIRFIEGLLFISMLPLHKDKPMRQQAMFLTGLQHLNEVLL